MYIYNRGRCWPLSDTTPDQGLHRSYTGWRAVEMLTLIFQHEGLGELKIPIQQDKQNMRSKQENENLTVYAGRGLSRYAH